MHQYYPGVGCPSLWKGLCNFFTGGMNSPTPEIQSSLSKKAGKKHWAVLALHWSRHALSPSAGHRYTRCRLRDPRGLFLPSTPLGWRLKSSHLASWAQKVQRCVQKAHLCPFEHASIASLGFLGTRHLAFLVKLRRQALHAAATTTNFFEALASFHVLRPYVIQHTAFPVSSNEPFCSMKKRISRRRSAGDTAAMSSQCIARADSFEASYVPAIQIVL